MSSNLENDNKWDKLTKDIISCVEQYREKVPKGALKFDKENIKSIEDALLFLEILFREEEKEIRDQQLHTLDTVNYENNVRMFAVSIVKLLYPKHNNLKNYDIYQKLIVQKHMAYALFHVLNNPMILLLNRIDDLEFRDNLYLGMVDFYKEFYGRFSDNEEAIELLCKFFPKTIDVERYKYKIALALYIHVSKAGTPEDTGYAYRGIAQIESHIKNLPEPIVMELLGLYIVQLVVSNKVFRHQIYTIIEYSQIAFVDKRIYKIMFLDSVILMRKIETFYAQKLQKNAETNFSSMLFEENYITGNIKVCKKPDAYWSFEKMDERVLFLNQKAVVMIKWISPAKIAVSQLDNKGILEFSGQYTDWLLETFFSRRVEQKLRKFLIGSINEYSRMFFSMLYLDNYRGMNNQIIDFDHKFLYDMKYKKLKFQNAYTYKIEKFYGKSVQTLSCIVGKNGMGKTSIIDFLRESFFKMLSLIVDYGVPCKEGYVKERDYQTYGILDEGAKFLTVFQLGKESFYLTNIDMIISEGIRPFTLGVYSSVNEFSKIAYFSNMMKCNQQGIFFEKSNWTGNTEIQTKREIGKGLSGFRQVDYSETESFIKKQKAILLEREKDLEEEKTGRKGSVNRELCYQLTFLKNMSKKKVCEYLDIDDKKEFKISSWMRNWKEEEFDLQDLKDTNRFNQLETNFLFLPDAQLQYFSSGQYAKFAFLAKLYWFLEGYRKEIERYQGIVGENEFLSDDALLDDETALIFIDEGETYYHPEWQRRYIQTLLEMVNCEGRSFQVQIVITTNSPFILSDILKEDVIYLTKEKEKRFDCTLGQNIHRLLKENFFMDYTIGEYARKLIEDIMLCLKNVSDEATEGKNSLQIKSQAEIDEL